MLADDLLTYIAAEITLDPDAVFDAATDLLATGLVDSLGVIEVVDWLEARFGGEIDPGDVVLENFHSVQAMVDFTTRRFGATS